MSRIIGARSCILLLCMVLGMWGCDGDSGSGPGSEPAPGPRIGGHPLFGAAMVTSSEYALQSVYCADLNGDGYDDAAVAREANGMVTVHLNDGRGLLGEPSSYAAAPGTWALSGADFDGDGDLDAATANAHVDNVSVILNTTIR
jgi:hypothetical protein